jgi:hypothetical protein
LLIWGCTSTTVLGRDLPANGGSSAAGTGAAGGSLAGLGGGAAEAGASPCQITKCQNRIYACGDCLDNDGDGAIDADDVQCTGPCDDTEDSFYGGIPGQNNAPCRQDCYFDGDTGSGNDGCDWSHTCDPLSLPPDYPPSGDASCAYDSSGNIPGGGSCAALALTQAAMCLDVCLPITPNGCDCFGCCELPAGSGSFVWLGSTQQSAGTCNENVLGDPTLCHPCTPVKSCFNACEPCEHCVGRPTSAPDCSTPSARCPGGELPCGMPDDAGCPSGMYCITGCCQVAPK